MINGKTIGIDARMVEMSGIGTYIQHLLGQGIYDYAVGNETEIRRYDQDVKIIPFEAPIYSPEEQLMFPAKEIRKAGITLMHFPHYNVPLRYNGRYVVTVHDLTHIILPEFLGNKIKYQYARLLMAHALKHAEHVFTVSNNSKKDIIHYFGTDEKKISVTYNAVDDDFREKEKTETDYLYDHFQLPRDKKFLLYVGNLKPHKNLETLLEAFQGMNRNDTILLLVGKAFTSIQLEEKEESLGIKDRVIHTGLVSKEELVDLYNLAEVFVFPSLYEGFGIPPLEAMACGTPVAAADNSSIPEVVGDAALLFDAREKNEIADAVEKLLFQPEICQDLVKKGYRRAAFFNWEKTRTGVTEALKDCLNC